MRWQQFLDLIREKIASGVVASSSTRLLPAAILGGLIGLEREFRHRAAGLRTNRFICFGAAMFTLLSERLAGVPADGARIAAQIVPTIGFIGAGSIIHRRGMTSGLTPAATIFVVASVGMAAGGGLYVTASFATALVLGSLFLLGYAEQNFNAKLLLTSYEVTGAIVDEISQAVNRILETHHRMMQSVLAGNTGQHVRLQIDAEATSSQQKDLFRELKASTVHQSAVWLGRLEHA